MSIGASFRATRRRRYKRLGKPAPLWVRTLEPRTHRWDLVGRIAADTGLPVRDIDELLREGRTEQEIRGGVR